MNKMIISGMILLGSSGAIFAAPPDYTKLNGLKGAELKAAVKAIALPHKEISYGDATWEAFSQADVRVIYDNSLEGEYSQSGREAWFDMYSNRLVWVNTGHSGMNIEHAVANSWWGGTKNAAYKDLHHLNPSDADANNRKNNNPLGMISGKPTWSNGLTNIGAPVAGIGGGASSVFEPAEEFKGDFARAYFYIFTIYDDITWQEDPACMYDLTAYPTLKPWAYEMLLKWAAEDPVDQREAQRNSTIAGIQENENPFISIPGLAEYIWGAKKDQPFNLAEAQTAPVRNRPAAPNFSWDNDVSLAGINTWTGRWWDAFELEAVSTESEDYYYCMTHPGDTEEKWNHVYGKIPVPAATEPGEVIVIKAYSTWWDMPDYRSSISTLTLTAVEEGTTDYMNARWAKVTDLSQINADSQYILVASKAGAVMSTTPGSTSSSAYITVSGNVEPDVNGEITRLPEGSAVVEFVEAGGGQYYVEVNDLALNPVGYVTSPAAKKAQISQEGMGAVVTLSPEKNVKINFGDAYGTLQYNAQSPRFSVYTSAQQALDLYRCVSQSSGTERIEATGRGEINAIYTIDGVKMNCGEKELPAGLYIIISGEKTRKILVR